MGNLIEEFVNRRVWAVVGASAASSKYGHKVFRTLRAAGYVVYGINPRDGEIEGEKLYRSLADLPEQPEVVDIVVPPKITEEIVRQCAELGLSRVWMQPGAESEEAIQYCHDHDIKVVHSVCAMIQKREW